MRGSVVLRHGPRMFIKFATLVLFLALPAFAEAAPDCLAPIRWQSAIQTKKAIPLTQVMQGLALNSMARSSLPGSARARTASAMSSPSSMLMARSSGPRFRPLMAISSAAADPFSKGF